MPILGILQRGPVSGLAGFTGSQSLIVASTTHRRILSRGPPLTNPREAYNMNYWTTCRALNARVRGLHGNSLCVGLHVFMLKFVFYPSPLARNPYVNTKNAKLYCSDKFFPAIQHKLILCHEFVGYSLSKVPVNWSIRNMGRWTHICILAVRE